MVDRETLGELCQCDNGIGYFDYSDCLSELTENGNVVETPEGYQITEKGARNADAVESSLPYSVRTKALKLIAPELAGNEKFRQRFVRESELAASIDHPNILPIYAAGEAEAVQARHAAYFAALAERAEPKIHSREQISWLDRLDREHGNLGVALAWCLPNAGSSDPQARGSAQPTPS